MQTRRVAVLSLAALAALSGQALAQPDVTHQTIQDALRYPSTGAPINGKYGYAWGSYTCNIGTQPLTWVSGGTPALAMNAYRLHDGRLMQIGLGNAKHSCCVGNGAGCGTCSTGPSGTLRPGCRDIYSASFNGGQTRLGPRSGINAFETTFTSIPGGSGDATWRRVQINVSDMDAITFAGAQYFAEGVYVCLEEGPAQAMNNATYRPMNVANSGTSPTYNWSIIGDNTATSNNTTRTGIPAIQAWRDHGLGFNQPDTSVSVVTVDVPMEGRFHAAGKVTSLPGGLYRYDYAVFNLNSDRSGGEFRVQVPTGATVTDVGFNAPPYHSGEVYSNTPWAFSRVGSSVTWASPEKFEQNANTNALRWGTMYNFWFTSNAAPAAAPTAGSVKLGLFKPAAAPAPTAVDVIGLPVPGGECVADFNESGGVTIQDTFDYLNAWFASSPDAEMDGVAGLTLDDVFGFLNAWFAGC